MCGIAGVWHTGAQNADVNSRARQARQMVDTLHHRGPDDAGAWADPTDGPAFGHRRLAVLDLSPAGHQPMQSVTGRYAITFNGELYNHLALRSALEAQGSAPAWRGRSDTETLLAAVEAWGLTDTLLRCVGMFAFALWDHRERTLQLVRDRFGEKPLYYGWSGGAFLFGSELKALRAYPGFDAPVCREALTQYLRFSYVPAPRSIYRGVFKLEPGCVLTVQHPPAPTPPERPLRPGECDRGVAVHRWWSLARVVEAGVDGLIHHEGLAVDLLEARLDEAVQLQSLAAVPLGAFLSGGVDSSTLVALLQRQARARGGRVQTFTVGFDEPGYDEAPFAQAVAAHLGTEHHALRVTAAEARAVIPELTRMYDEPFADSSQVPTHLLCRAARAHVTVALSGDGSDELFGGYTRHVWAPRLWQRMGWMPFGGREALGELLSAVPARSWDWLAERRTLSSRGVARPGEAVHKLAERLRTARDRDGLYQGLVSSWHDPASLVRGAADAVIREPAGPLGDPLPCPPDAPLSMLDRMLYRDAMGYLPDDILCKVDRAAMACGLETRAPFLDHRVAEVAWRLAPSLKVRERTGKWALRQVLFRHVPPALVDRPKAGFAIPLGAWLRGPLRAWGEALLSEARLQREGYLHAAPVRCRWEEHQQGRRDHSAALWPVLMFQSWLEATHHGDAP